MWCLTCGFSPENPDNADDEHMSYDGAHYPNWIEDELEGYERQQLSYEQYDY